MPEQTTTQAPEVKATPQSATASWMGGLSEAMKNVPDISGKPIEDIAPIERPEPEAKPDARPDARPAAQPDKPATPEAPEDKWPRSAKDWDAFKSARKQKEEALAAQLKERDAKLAEYETKLKATPSGEFETLKQQLAEREKQANEYSEMLKQTALERHPQFKSYFENQTNAQIDIAKSIMGEDNAKRLKHVLSLDDGEYKKQQLRDLTGSLEALELAQIGNVITSIQKIDRERGQVLSNSKAEYEALINRQKEEQTKTVQQTRQQSEKAFEVILTDVTGRFDLFKPKAGDEAWNKEIQETVANAKQLIFGENRQEDLIQAALAAATIPRMVKMGQAQTERIKQLEEQVKQLSASSPRLPNTEGVTGASGGVGSPGVKQGSRPMDASNAFAKTMAEAMNNAMSAGR